MELNEIILSAVDFFKSEPIIAIVCIVIIAVLFYFKKKAMFRILAIILVLALVYYFITMIGGFTFSGVSQKETLIEKSEQ